MLLKEVSVCVSICNVIVQYSLRISVCELETAAGEETLFLRWKLWTEFEFLDVYNVI